jgi:hypothetical protein
MATWHGVQKDGMMLIVSLELLLSRDSVSPHREREAFVFAQPLRWRAIAMVLVVGLRRNQICRKAKAVVYNFGIQGFQSCHYGL